MCCALHAAPLPPPSHCAPSLPAHPAALALTSPLRAIRLTPVLVSRVWSEVLHAAPPLAAGQFVACGGRARLLHGAGALRSATLCLLHLLLPLVRWDFICPSSRSHGDLAVAD